jgi:hypothetical protein
MRVDRCGLRGVLVLACLLVATVPIPSADAQTNRQQVARGASVGLQCVPFARYLSGIDIVGDARTWWRQAEGRYERGSRPEVGSVLTFRPSGSMRLGHVSVVSQIISDREILVDHANWPGPGVPRGRVARNVSVIDVSSRNDWTAVRVEIHGRGSGYGRVYPTWGFIHARPASQTVLASTPSSDLSPAVARVNARAAAAAARPPAFVGQPGAGLEARDLVELAEAADTLPRPARTTPAVAARQAMARDFGDDTLMWGAPYRSLR